MPLTHPIANVIVLPAMILPRPCPAYYYGGLPIKGTRRKGNLRIEDNILFFTVPETKAGEAIDLKIPFSAMEKIFLTRDNYYGSDTVIFNLSFHNEQGKSFTIRFAPTIIIPRRRIFLQQQWFEFLSQTIPAPKKSKSHSKNK
jgi:hypothetical protein